MFKNNVTHIKSGCPLQTLHSFIIDKTYDILIERKTKHVTIGHFTNDEIEFMTGCLISYNDFSVDFLAGSNAFDQFVMLLLSQEIVSDEKKLEFFQMLQIAAVNYYNKDLMKIIADLHPCAEALVAEYYAEVNFE